MPGPLRVLFIEDSESEYQYLSRTLSRGGLVVDSFRVSSRQEVEEALDNGTWDLILSNTHLESFTPQDGLKLLQSRQLDIPFILISDHIGEEKVVALLKAGASDFVNFNNLPRLIPAIEREIKEAARRREAEETKRALHLSENRYRQLVDDSPIPILLLQHDQIVFLNKSAKQTLAVDDETSLINRPVEALFLDTHEVMRDTDLLTQEHRSGKSFETIFRRADDHLIQVEVFARTVGHEGSPATQLVFTDITQRKESEAKLQQAVQIIEHTMEGVVITDAEGRITSVNPAFCDITGYSETEIISLHPDLLRSDRHPPEFCEELWKQVQEKGS